MGASSSPLPEAAADPDARPAVWLRMEEVGGFAPFQASLLRVPAFTLLGDGRVIFQALVDPAGDGTFPPLQQVTLDPDQANALVDRALDEFGLRDARADYAADGVADATTTVFTVDDDGVSKTVSVYGLGFSDEGPDREALAVFLELAELLAGPDAWLPEGADVTTFAPLLYRGVFTEDDPLGPDLIPWPWEDLTPADLTPHAEATSISQADLTPEQVGRLADVPSGGAFDIAISAPDGTAAWRLALRPLLPDEAALLPAQPASTPTATTPADEGDYGY
jgi:hypothetical protein